MNRRTSKALKLIARANRRRRRGVWINPPSSKHLNGRAFDIGPGMKFEIRDLDSTYPIALKFSVDE